MKISHVLLFLTYRCNLRCDFCLSFNGYWRPDSALPFAAAVAPALSLGSARAIREMSTTDIVDRVIPQCAENGVEVIALSGGEVLVRKDVITIFNALGQSKMKWCFDSNLMLCTDEIASEIIASRCATVFVSIDGPQDTHNKLRCSPKERLLAARRANSASKTTLVVNCVLQPGNETSPQEMVELAARCEAAQLTFQLLSERSYRQAFDAEVAAQSLRNAKAAAQSVGMTMSVYPVQNPHEEELRSWFSMPLSRRFFGGCTYIYNDLRIDPEGNVIPCLEYKLGNILEENLADIWTGPSYNAFRQHFTQSGPYDACLRCCNMKSPPNSSAEPVSVGQVS
jgi:MoaA/NifB/PqqE/SkfB family radical SAM enzyme